MHFDDMYYPYSSQRMVVYAANGMVGTSQHLASQAGLDVMKKGGNAIDAALAAAACLTVVEPTSNGIGGDAFALIWFKGKLYGLNASGCAPRGISAAKLKNAGLKNVPKYGWAAVTVPGQPAGWAALSQRFGRLPLSEVVKPAVHYAADGFPVSPVVALNWRKAFEEYKVNLKGEEFKPLFDTFTREGSIPQAGQIISLPDHAATLELIGQTYARDFYSGSLADKIDRFSRKYGGYLTVEDLAGYGPEWVEPIAAEYRGYQVWEIPPNGHGLVVLMALKILNSLEYDWRDPADACHKQIEALKLAFADGIRYIADSKHMAVSTEQLLAEDYAAQRRKKIGRSALEPEAGVFDSGGTVYLAAADSEGNMISYIQSNYTGFGSGLVVPGTGISLHNRGNNFNLEEGHHNCLQPGKKPYHTIIPGFLTANGKAVGPFGVMGAFMQPQGHLQVIVNTIDHRLNPQAALDAPRWQWTGGKTIEIESSFPRSIAEQLALKGHDIKVSLNTAGFGRGQIIWRGRESLVGGTEPRADSAMAAW